MITRNLNQNAEKYKKRNSTYSADGKLFNLNNISNLLISLNNQEATKEGAKFF